MLSGDQPFAGLTRIGRYLCDSCHRELTDRTHCFDCGIDLCNECAARVGGGQPVMGHTSSHASARYPRFDLLNAADFDNARKGLRKRVGERFGYFQRVVLPWLDSAIEEVGAEALIADGATSGAAGKRSPQLIPYAKNLRFLLTRQQRGRFDDYFGRRALGGSEVPAATLSYSQGTFHTNQWKGMPLEKTVYDAALYPLMLWEIRPKTIIEIGSGSGASAIWLGDHADIMGLQTRIYSFDRRKITKTHFRVTFVEGDCHRIEEALPETLLKTFAHPWIVIEDAHENVLGVLRHFGRLMEEGDYLVVEDSEPVKENAIGKFLTENPSAFAVDTRYTDYFGYNATCSVDSIFRKMSPGLPSGHADSTSSTVEGTPSPRSGAIRGHETRRRRLPAPVARTWRATKELPRRLQRTASVVRNLLDNRILWHKSSKTQIGIMLRGGVGDVMIAARWLRSALPALAAKADIAVDLYYALPENIVFIFGKFPQVRYLYRDVAFEQVRQYYDFSFVINHLGYMEIDYPRLEKKLETLPFADLVRSWAPGIEEFAPFTTRDYHPDLGKNFYGLIAKHGFLRHSILEHQTGVAAATEPFPFALPDDAVVAKHPSLAAKYITVHDGWDVQLGMEGRRPTKSYPLEMWDALVGRIKERHPELAIVQLGGSTGSPIPGVDLDLRRATDFGTSAKILQGATLHLDTDSGLVHVATALGTKCVVLFGPTDIRYYGYPANINVHAEGCNNCWLRTGNWIIACMLGDPVPRCMASIETDAIIGAIDASLCNDLQAV